MLTVTDLFCGAGGSSSGAELVPGVRIRMAANHWKLAVDTHNRNLPHADHDTADISQVDPRRYPTTDFLWVSPSCTHHSKAQGHKRSQQPSLFGDHKKDDDAAERSRATMWDGLRFAEYHRYRAVIVENVIDVRDWEMWPAWLHGWDCLGYEMRIVYLNSMFANQLGDPAAQSRNRLYGVAWRRGERRPDLDRWTRPVATCASCDTTAPAIQAWKDPRNKAGSYGRNGQYWYRCPKAGCHAIVYPPVHPAATAIDWSDLGVRIGDRSEELKPATIARIERGLRKYGRAPLLTPAGGTWNDDARPTDEPMRTRTARETEGLTVPPLLVPVEARQGVNARSSTEPLRTQTTRAETALVVPLRRNGVAKPAAVDPLPTVAAGGTHHMLVAYYGNGGTTSTNQPVPTIPTRERFALVSTDVPAVQDCTFRMLTVEEIRAGMAFASDYVILGSSKRVKVRQLGNAVTPPAARDLIAALVEAITGEQLEVA